MTVTSETFEDRIETIRRQIDAGSCRIAARESADIVEIAFRELFKRGIGLIDGAARHRVMQKEAEIGKGNKGVEDFTLGQLVHLFRDTNFLDAWAKATGTKLRGIQMINLDEVVRLRNMVVHHNETPSRGEADLLFQCVQTFLETFGILTLGMSTARSTASEAESSSASSSRQDATRRAPTANAPTTLRMVERGRPRSNYRPHLFEEPSRLQRQGRRTRKIDADMFSKALGVLPADRPLIGLDIGCAMGDITVDRFRDKRFGRVVAVDHVKECIDMAKESHGSLPVFEFHRLDVEDLAFEAQFVEILGDEETLVDVAFLGLSLHHVSTPIKLLRTLRRRLAPGGFVLVRTSDDGTNLAYPDESGRFARLIDMGVEQPLTSDRLHGRKLYYQYYRAGFRDIVIEVHPFSTADLDPDERNQMFRESFSWRRNAVVRAIETGDESPELRAQLAEIDDLLSGLELDFEDDSFFYCESYITGVARK